MTPRERAEQLANGMAGVLEIDNDVGQLEYMAAMITQAIEADRAERTISDIPARRQCDTCSLVHENCVEINTGEGPDRANSATLCGHCVETIRRELATVERERDEALATIADFHKSRIRKQTEREAAMDAEITRLARTVDRKDEQMAELQEHAGRLESALRETYALVKRNFVSLDPSGMYTNEVPPGAQVRIKAALRQHIDAALSPSPAQPATATKEECADCDALQSRLNEAEAALQMSCDAVQHYCDSENAIRQATGTAHTCTLASGAQTGTLCPGCFPVQTFAGTFVHPQPATATSPHNIGYCSDILACPIHGAPPSPAAREAKPPCLWCKNNPKFARERLPSRHGCRGRDLLYPSDCSGTRK